MRFKHRPQAAPVPTVCALNGSEARSPSRTLQNSDLSHKPEFYCLSLPILTHPPH